MARGQKGTTFERDICRKLSLWWTRGQHNDVLWRNPSRITRKTRNNEAQLGDIRATDEIALPLTNAFVIECKAGYSIKNTKSKATAAAREGKKERVRNVPWDLLDGIDGRQGDTVIMKFWMQTAEEARIANKTPLLIFKRDFHQPVICITDQLYAALEEFTWVNGEAQINKISSITLHAEGVAAITFMSLDRFLEVVLPSDIRAMIKEGHV